MESYQCYVHTWHVTRILEPLAYNEEAVQISKSCSGVFLSRLHSDICV